MYDNYTTTDAHFAAIKKALCHLRAETISVVNGGVRRATQCVSVPPSAQTQSGGGGWNQSVCVCSHVCRTQKSSQEP